MTFRQVRDKVGLVIVITLFVLYLTLMLMLAHGIISYLTGGTFAQDIGMFVKELREASQ